MSWIGEHSPLQIEAHVCFENSEVNVDKKGAIIRKSNFTPNNDYNQVQ